MGLVRSHKGIRGVRRPGINSRPRGAPEPNGSGDSRRRRVPDPPNFGRGDTRGPVPWSPVTPVGWDTRWARSFHEEAFVGWTSLGEAVDGAAEFLATNVATIAGPGVYAVFAPLDWTPRFKTRGRFENVIEPWSEQRLRQRWIDGPPAHPPPRTRRSRRRARARAPSTPSTRGCAARRRGRAGRAGTQTPIGCQAEDARLAVVGGVEAHPTLLE